LVLYAAYIINIIELQHQSFKRKIIMAGTYKPLVIVAGKLQQIQAGSTLVGSDGSTARSLFSSADPLYGFGGLTATGIVVKSDANGGVLAVTLAGTANQINIANADGINAAPTFSIASNVVLPGTGAMTVPMGTTGQTPAAAPGQVRYDTTLNELVWSDSTAWHNLSTGGTVTSVGLALPSIFS
jgi:hypothetical protein